MGNSEMELPIFGDKAIGIRISPKLCEVCYFSMGFIVGIQKMLSYFRPETP